MRSVRFCLLTLLLLTVGCATSPTGQPQLRLFPEDQMARMGVTAFEEMKQEVPASRDAQVNAYVQCVAAAILGETDMRAAWEVQVFDSSEINAFALPGGKIGVYAGLLGVAENQDQLAAVVAHEVAHVIARHGNARVSAAFATQAGMELAQVISGTPTPAKGQLFGLLGLGAQYGILMPYGRAQETEADLLGLDIMARAGFDPPAAVTLWRNMAAATGGRQPPGFLSTHPSHEGRIERLNERMPRALELREAARRQGKAPACR